MGLSKAYDELTDTPEFSDGIILSTGQAIEDSNGVIRFNIIPNRTGIYGPSGIRRIATEEGVGTDLDSYPDTPVRIVDRDGGFQAVNYLTSASAPGTLELTNANLYKPVSANSTVGYIRSADESTDEQTAITSQVTNNVGTSAVEIINPSDVDGLGVQSGGMIMVTGRDASNFFADIVVYAGEGGGVSSIGSETRQTAASRSYGFSGDGQGITLSMSSGSYNVQAVAISGQQ